MLRLKKSSLSETLLKNIRPNGQRERQQRAEGNERAAQRGDGLK
jgi:hypothetical protein